MLRSIIFTLTLAAAFLTTGVFAQDVTSQNGVTAIRGVNSIAVSWTNTCTVCSWQLSTKGQGKNDPTISTVRPRGTTSYSIPGLLPGQEYTINMSANRAGRFVSRALLTVTTLPIPPSGSWTPTDISSIMSFPNCLTSSSSELALAGLDTGLKPVGRVCNPNVTECSNVTDGLDPKINASNSLQYDPNGNLYGIYTYPVLQLYNSTHTLTYKLPVPPASRWIPFKDYLGISLSLDVTSTGVLTGTTFTDPFSPGPSWGEVVFDATDGIEIAHAINLASSRLTAVAYDGQGIAYVGGLDYTANINVQPFASLWRWDRTTPGGHTFTKIPLPVVMTSITDMVSDGHGVVYIAGSDNRNNGRVWKYKNGVVTDTGLAAFQVTVLEYSSNGYLVAGGQDKVNYNGQVWYYNPLTTSWISLGLTGANVVVNVTVNNFLNIVYGLGKTFSNQSTVWTYQNRRL